MAEPSSRKHTLISLEHLLSGELGRSEGDVLANFLIFGIPASSEWPRRRAPYGWSYAVVGLCARPKWVSGWAEKAFRLLIKASNGHSSISNDLGALTSVTSSKVVTPFTADEWSQGRPSTITGFQASAAKVLRKSYFFTVLFCTLDFGGLGEPSGPPGGVRGVPPRPPRGGRVDGVRACNFPA